VLVIDAANVIGSRPDGWWRDRAGAAGRFVRDVRAAVRDGVLEPGVVVVLEGRARSGAPPGLADDVEVVHALGEGDDAVVASVAGAAAPPIVVSADRGLVQRVEALGAQVVGPRWLLSRLDRSGA
jgi:hypothetical protein